MADAITLQSWTWTDSGTEPTQGDESYASGEQPIAEYDNWAMWAVTTDIDSLNAELGAHASNHEAGGQDEIDLSGLDVGTAAQFVDNAGAFEVQTTGGSTMAAISGGDWTTFPDINDAFTLKQDMTLGGGRTIQVGQDSGAQTLVDMAVTSSPTAGVEQSYMLAVDGSSYLKAYAEADGAGGIQNAKLESYVDTVIAAGNDLTLGNDLVAAGGEVIWDESAGHIEQNQLENDSLTITGGNAISGGAVSLGGSVTVGVQSNSIQTDELDLSIAPTWTGAHTFNGGITMGGPLDLNGNSLEGTDGVVLPVGTDKYVTQ